MAAKEGWERIREREDQEAREREDALQAEVLKKRLQSGGKSLRSVEAEITSAVEGESGIPSEKLVEFLERAEHLLEQVNALYSQYFLGVMRVPPNDRRRHLDHLMRSLALMQKPTQVLQFRFKSAQARYRIFLEQWDRKTHDIESGKVVRRNLSRGR